MADHDTEPRRREPSVSDSEEQAQAATSPAQAARPDNPPRQGARASESVKDEDEGVDPVSLETGVSDVVLEDVPQELEGRPDLAEVAQAAFAREDEQVARHADDKE